MRLHDSTFCKRILLPTRNSSVESPTGRYCDLNRQKKGLSIDHGLELKSFAMLAIKTHGVKFCATVQYRQTETKTCRRIVSSLMCAPGQ